MYLFMQYNFVINIENLTQILIYDLSNKYPIQCPLGIFIFSSEIFVTRTDILNLLIEGLIFSS